jgi:diguanylate cyclase (GGDEF)-like protein
MTTLQAIKLTRLSRGDWWQRVRTALLGLQCKATVLVVALILLTSALLCGLSVRSAWSLANRLERERTIQQARMVSRLAGSTFLRGDPTALQPLLDEVVTGDPLWYAFITGADGTVLAMVDRTGLIPSPPVAEGPALVGVPQNRTLPGGGRPYLGITFPIDHRSEGIDQRTTSASEPLGYVHLGINRDQTIAEFDASADLVVGIGITIVLLSIPLGFFVVRRIVEPINEISRVAVCFSAGDTNARSAVRRSDEIGVLASKFNRMADEVARKHTEVVNLNEELEDRVLERTEQLRELASRDPLTGLYNRRHFNEVLLRCLSEARRYRSELSVMMIDMDRFKTVNDELGHQTGDDVLILAARTIAAELRAEDVAARFGGDEFIVLMPRTDENDARKLAARVADRFRTETSRKHPTINVSLSIGIASLTDSSAETDQDLIRIADFALYEAKARGRNRIVSRETPVQ